MEKMCSVGDEFRLDSCDKIHLKGLEFYAYHGVLPEEGVLGQKFVVDVDIYADLLRAAQSDDVNATINYTEVYEFIREIVTGARSQLLEHLAERIARGILEGFACLAVRVEVHKPQAPIHGVFRDVSVEIIRRKGR